MKTFLASSSVVAFSLATVCVVSGQTSPFYITGDLGGTITDNANLSGGSFIQRDGFPEIPISGTVKFDPGARLGLGVGYHVTDWLGVEAVSGFMASEIDSSHDSSFSNIPLMAGVRLEWPGHLRLAPYVGASAGGAISVLDADHLNLNGVTADGTQSDIVFAYQALAGLRYEISPRMGIGIEYHYFSTQATDWKLNNDYVTSDRFRISKVTVNSLSVAFQYNF